MSTFCSESEIIRRNRILSSKLYFDVPPSKVPVIYSSSYNIEFMGIEKLHPFDSSKWGRVCQFLHSAAVLKEEHVVEPEEASKDDLLVVHSEKYLDSLKSSHIVASIMEVPQVARLPDSIIQQHVLHPFRKQVGGSILAAKLAKEQGWAINVGGGFHHCSADRGGGFCAYADISLCIHFAFVHLNISRVMIIDLDAHQGNGHETDFSSDRRVYILDMYNPHIYPLLRNRIVGPEDLSDQQFDSAKMTFLSSAMCHQKLKEDYTARRYIDQEVEVPSGTSTDEYLQKLDSALEGAGQMCNPELVVYNAGTDILDGDPLGKLRVSPDGIIKRDEKVFAFCRGKNIPLLMLTSASAQCLTSVICGYMKSSARVIADSIINLSNKELIDMRGLENDAATGSSKCGAL